MLTLILSLHFSIIILTGPFSSEISNDTRICDVQIPELKSNLVLPRGLRDPLVCCGHTTSFNCHTLYWRYMHGIASYFLCLCPSFASLAIPYTEKTFLPNSREIVLLQSCRIR